VINPDIKMKRLHILLTALMMVFVQMAASAPTTVYVTTNGTGVGYPTWADATNSIQTAIDIIDGTNPTNTVWVSNGVYNIGGVINYPSGSLLTNRVAIWKAITVRSINNDLTNTIIVGAKDTVGGTPSNGPAAVRCVYMTNGSSLIGFTLTNGATFAVWENNGSRGGGIYSSGTISNCVLVGNSAYYTGGGVDGGTLYNCTLIANNGWGGYAGGAYGSTLHNCRIISNNNNGGLGGGGYGCIMSNCTLIGNSVSSQNGGGANNSTLYNCTLITNTGSKGGGAYGSTLYNCTLISNSASSYGGGGVSCIMSNCTLIGNSSPYYGGGACKGTLYNCTLSSNSGADRGGGASGWDGVAVRTMILIGCTLSNNSAPQGGGTYCCTNFNCTLIGNSASAYTGGGAYGGILYNCLIAGNQSARWGGGASGGSLYNCTVVGNKTTHDSYNTGAGVYQSAIYNTIVYSNMSVAYPYDTDGLTSTNYSCSPNITPGNGNITNAPQFVNWGSGYGTNFVMGDLHLQITSPGINAGNNAYVTTTTDLDGHSRIDHYSRMVDMGCYEYLNSGAMYRFGF
jgi:hypothetical protein